MQGRPLGAAPGCSEQGAVAMPCMTASFFCFRVTAQVGRFASAQGAADFFLVNQAI
jgi:hypothetical protein